MALDDTTYLRQAIRLSENALARGNRPFGAVLVSAEGETLAEAENTTSTDGDLTAHAEMNALRAVSVGVSQERLAGATMYASGEPCPMCAGALLRLGVGRVVFGIRNELQLRYFAKASNNIAGVVHCRDIFKLLPSPVEVIGPLLEEEATRPFIAFAAKLAGDLPAR